MEARTIDIALRRTDGSEKAAARVAVATTADFVRYANRAPVIIQFKRADTAANRDRQIVGQSSGYRQAVRNLAFVPANKHPKTASGVVRGTRVTYYDFGRANWRAFRDGNLIAISAFWSIEAGRFVGTPEEAGIDGLPEFGDNALGPLPATDGTREARTADRQARTRQREKDRAGQRQRDRAYSTARQARARERRVAKLNTRFSAA